MYDRLELLFGKENLDVLAKKHIILVGMGGVGSFCFEVLIRSGIKKLTIIDFDTYEESNLNRQLHSNQNTIGHKKVEVLKNYAKNINNNITVNALDMFIDESTNLDLSKYDYIIDAVDSLKAKMMLILKATEQNIPIISSLGMAGKVNPSDICITTLEKTYNDPLAKKLRIMLKKEDFKGKVKVVFSKELPQKSKRNLPSYISVTAYAGILLADTVIKDLIK